MPKPQEVLMTDSASIPGGWLAGSPWRDLRLHARLHPGEGRRMMEVEDVSDGGVHAAWALVEGRAALMLPAGDAPAGGIPPGSSRMETRSESLGGRQWFTLVCRDSSLESVFLRFCEAVIRAMSEGRDAKGAVADVMKRFRRLFAHGGQEVTSERIAGLFAELTVLEWLLDHVIEAVGAWIGPFGESHDFAFGNRHLEVKALPASGERRFRVSGLLQLEEPENGWLHLVGVRLVPGGETIADIVERIIPRLEAGEEEKFAVALDVAGCGLPVGDEWKARGFEPGRPELWTVGEGFPRIVPSTLISGMAPEGVRDIGYTVSLERAGRFATGEEELMEALRGEWKVR